MISFFSCDSDNAENPPKVATAKLDTNNIESANSELRNRDVWQNPDYVIQLLGDISNQTVADIGAGSGYFSFKILPKARKLIAVDIDRKFIKLMEEKVSTYPLELRNKFEARLAIPEDPKLEPNEIQTALVVNTYIYIQDRVQYFKNLKKALSNNGRLVIIDFKNIDLPVGPHGNIKLSDTQVVEELKQAGYSNITSDNKSLKYQYVIIAENHK